MLVDIEAPTVEHLHSLQRCQDELRGRQTAASSTDELQNLRVMGCTLVFVSPGFGPLPKRLLQDGGS